MGRPPLGPAKRSKHIALHVTEAQHAQIQARGGTEWVRRTVLAALAPRRAAEPVQKPPTPPPVDGGEPESAENTPHRHKRERVADKWVRGTNVGEYRCATCGVPMGVFQ